MRRTKKVIAALVDPTIALALMIGYIALLLVTVRHLGYARDEGFYFRAAHDYRIWFVKLFRDPAAAVRQDVVDRFWRTNHEHPAFVKSLFALSNQFLFHDFRVFSEEGTSFRFPGMLLSSLAVATTYSWGRQAIGRLPGLVAALLFAMMPRIFYHSHLDCFDMPVTAMWLVTTYAYWLSLERGGLGWPIVTGVLYGLLLNTKHNAWLLPPALVVHFLISRGARGLSRDIQVGHTRAPIALLCMATIGPLVFFATWPWIWFDTARRLSEYIAFHTGHEYYNMEFLGVTYFRPPMPRLYAWVMTVATVPTTTLVLFGVGLWRSMRSIYWPRVLMMTRRFRRRRGLRRGLARREFANLMQHGGEETSSVRRRRVGAPGLVESTRSRLSTHTLWLLCILASYAPWFSSNTPIFGGTKHWITAYPFMALFAGWGFREALIALRRATPTKFDQYRVVELGLTLSVLVAPTVMTLHSNPWGLSTYVPLVGGAPGAASLGLNRCFWGYTTGAVTDFLNEKAPRNARVYIHDTAQESWNQFVEDRRIRSDLHGTLSLSASDVALYHHEQHMARVEFQIWVDYGTVSPAHIGAYDGVPVIWVFQRPKTRAPAAQREDDAVPEFVVDGP